MLTSKIGNADSDVAAQCVGDRLGASLEAGMVGLNTGSVSIEAAPFGGIKQSGLGREGGQEGIEEYLETKTFHWGGLC